MVLVGFYFSGKNKSAAQFTKASGTIPGWAIGISIFLKYAFLRNPLHYNMVIVVGSLTIFLTGLLLTAEKRKLILRLPSILKC